MDRIDRAELINALNKLAMERHEKHIPLVEHDFRELIHQAKSVDDDEDYEKSLKSERVEMGAVK